MSTKKTALEKIADDEEVFALRGRDLSAPQTICFWIAQNIVNPECPESKLTEALAVALRMRAAEFRRAAD